MVDHLRNAYRCFATGDATALSGLFSPSTVYHLPGRHLGGGTLVGRDAIFRRTVAAARWCDVPPAIELRDVSGTGSLVTSFERLQAARGPSRLDQHVAVVWRFERGQCAELWSHFEDQPACDAFWRTFTPT